MTIRDVEILRDGGTILFTLSGTDNAGCYRLQTPFLGEPRLMFLNDRQLEIGSHAERELVMQLAGWLREAMTEDREKALTTLDKLKVWRNLPKVLLEVIPLHRIRTVLECLMKRCSQPNAKPIGVATKPL